MEELFQLDVPSPTKQALMMMKGVEIFLEPNLAASTGCHSGQTAFGTAPPYIDLVSRSAKLPKKPRILKDMDSMVTMVPKDAIFLTILLDVTSQVYICEYVLDEHEDCIQQNWWRASAYTLQTFHFKQVFQANTIVHGWLHFNRENKINLGIFDISNNNRQPSHHMKIEQRSGQLHGMFCDAVKQHGSVGQLSWVWTGQLGHDEMGTNSQACGACDVVCKDNWCFDIDYLLKFTDNQQEHELIEATCPISDNMPTSPPRKRFKSLSIFIPPNV